MVGQSIGQQLDERDQMLMAQTFEFAMEKAPTNEMAQWENPDSGQLAVPLYPHQNVFKRQKELRVESLLLL